jgi:carboxynorspermidine decarboxylase
MGIDYSTLPSPCFVMDEGRLRSNLETLAVVKRHAEVDILCALKGFANYATFALLREYLDGVAASSLHEARLGAEEFGREVHAYCPAYVPSDFVEIAKLATHLTFNSIGEYARHRSELAQASPGLRINPEYAEVETDLYNPCVPGSRLGVTAEQLEDGLPSGIEGLHFHTLCEKGSDTLERTLERVEARFGHHLDRVRWLNLGGGHAITRAGYELERLTRVLRETRERHPNLERIILEPGSAVAWETGELVSSVLDIVENQGTRTAMLDVSFSAHMPDCLEMPYRPEVLRTVTGGHRYNLGGQTCLAGDFLPDYEFEGPLAVGDRVVFLDMIHYTMVKTTTFNGVNLPSIAIAREDGTVEVVKRFGYKDYRRRL